MQLLCEFLPLEVLTCSDSPHLSWQVEVVDVVSLDTCVCQTEDGKLLEGEYSIDSIPFSVVFPPFLARKPVLPSLNCTTSIYTLG